jgi:putative transcriptional regulator
MSKLFEEMAQGTTEARAYMEGERKGFKVTLPSEVDVKAIRKRLSMTQARFSDTFGFSLDAVKHWEGGRRTPESSARAFLTVIASNPQAVISALHQPAIANAMMVSTKVATAKTEKWRMPVAAAQKGRWRAKKSKPIKGGGQRRQGSRP